MLVLLAAVAIGAAALQPIGVGAATSLTADERAAMLTRHNEVRAHYGTAALTWDDALATYAQEWADQLAAGDGTLRHRSNPRYGENLYGSFPPGTSTMTNVVDSWASEVKDYNIQDNTCTAICGHFTQVVWSSTTKVGCGKATGAGWDFVVCNYDPSGNVLGAKPGITQPSSPTAPAGAAAPAATTTEPAPTTPAATTPATETTTPAAAGVALDPASCFQTFRSGSGVAPATLTFDNQTTAAVTLYWIDFDANAVPWFEVEAGAKLAQETYATHAWAVTTGNSRCLGIHVAVAGPSTLVIK